MLYKSDSAFSCLSFSLIVHFSFSQNFLSDFSGTTSSRILKFATNIGYDQLYCIKENQHPHACHSLYLSVFLSFS